MLHFDTFSPAPGIILRYAYAPCAGSPRATVLLLNGRAEYIEKYDEVITELNARAFDVWTLDWRGQGMSSRELENPDKGYVERFEDYVLDLDVFCKDHVLSTERASRGPLLILAHSMGGNIALRYLYQNSSLFKAAVFIAPMFDIRFPLPELAVRLLFKTGIGLGFGDHHIGGDYGAFQRTFKNNPWTRSRERFEHRVAQIETQPALALGGPTLEWLNAALDACEFLRRPSVARSITTPALFVINGDDSVVNPDAIHRFANHMPNAKTQVVPGSQHEVLIERDHLRAIFWNAFDSFIEDVLHNL